MLVHDAPAFGRARRLDAEQLSHREPVVEGRENDAPDYQTLLHSLAFDTRPLGKEQQPHMIAAGLHHYSRGKVVFDRHRLHQRHRRWRELTRRHFLPLVFLASAPRQQSTLGEHVQSFSRDYPQPGPTPVNGMVRA